MIEALLFWGKQLYNPDQHHILTELHIDLKVGPQGHPEPGSIMTHIIHEPDPFLPKIN